jgi:hypothetical protein
MAERMVKVALSVAAIALFGAAAAMLFKLDSFGPAPAYRAQQASGARGMASGVQVPPVPVPPDTEEVMNTASKVGWHKRYQSRLSEEGLWLFYMQEMPRNGWRRDEAFEKARSERAPGELLLAFKSPPAACIISIAPEGSFTTAVTVMVLNSPDRAAGAI